MINRLRQIATHFNLSPAAFADQVGVSRPVISHIFSERNKPSLEVIQKIGIAFPELDLVWLLYGEGQMLKRLVKEEDNANAAIPVTEPKMSSELKMEDKQASENTATQATISESQVAINSVSKQVRKIVFFYSDNTFQEFAPDSK